MKFPEMPIQPTPKQFEETVREFLTCSGTTLESFETCHRERIDGMDGLYEIDVTVRFKFLCSFDLLCLVECKHVKHPVKREVVQLLHSKLGSTGAHKGMIFSTSGFQSGAVEFARTHGIALVHVTDGQAANITCSKDNESAPRLGVRVSHLVGWLNVSIGDGPQEWELVHCLNAGPLRLFLGIEASSTKDETETYPSEVG